MSNFMRTNNRPRFTSFLFLFVSVIALALLPLSAHAQKPGYYPIYSGTSILPTISTNLVYTPGTSTNTWGLPGTSTNLIQSVAEYETARVHMAWTNAPAATNSIVGVAIYSSADNGITFSTSPTWQLTNAPIAPGLLQTVLATNLDVKGITHLAFVPYNTTGGAVSNLILGVNLKAPKFYTLPARQ